MSEDATTYSKESEKVWQKWSSNAQATKAQEVKNTYCHTIDVNLFKPQEVNVLTVHNDNPLSKACMYTANPKVINQVWSVQDGLLPPNETDFFVCVKKLFAREDS